MSAKIGGSVVLALLAWLSLGRAFRPFGLLVISRYDVLQSAGAALLSGLLLWLSYCVWMLPGAAR